MLGYNRKEDTSLYSKENSTKFLIFFKKEGILKKKRIDYSNKDWDKKTRIRNAKDERDLLKDLPIEINTGISLNDFAEEHFKHLEDTSWSRTKISHYNRYIKPVIGKKKLKDIKVLDIKKCLKQQEEIHNLAPRTRKQTLEVLKPIFNSAIENEIRTTNPTLTLTVKRPSTKKVVNNPRDYIVSVYYEINSVFENDPFYKSLFLFYLQGRRKSEPLKLKWKHIDFNNNTYICENVKNGETQTFYLPENIKELLLQFSSNNLEQYVYEGNIKGQHIKDFRKQTEKIRKNIDGFTLHYLRNVIVTMMGQEGISGTHMSGALGHNNINTLSQYLSMPYSAGSKIASNIIDTIVNYK